MFLTDLLPIPLVEYGRHGFPGYGNRLFSQQFYQFMVNQLTDIEDQPAKEWLTDWLSDLFRRDNGKFSAERFKAAVAANKHYRSSPTFQQRHLYYLAQHVKEITDPHVHQFVARWLGEIARRTNYNFQQSRWDKFTQRPNVEPNETGLEEQGGPGFGSRSHAGFGKKIFQRRYLEYIAAKLADIEDDAVRQHLVQWFSEMFKLDNSAFKPEVFAQWVEAGGREGYVEFQARHFYFLAHEIAEVQDIHERTFLCDWVGEIVGRTNRHFNKDRWKQFCDLPKEDSRRMDVAHSRGKAKGDPNPPETYWQQRQRKEREQATEITREE